MATLGSAYYVAFPNPLPRNLTPVPFSVLTDICTKDALVFQIHISNTTAGALTCLVQDKQTVPGELVPTATIAAKTAYVIAWPEGIPASGGLSVQGSATGLQISIVGSYKT